MKVTVRLKGAWYRAPPRSIPSGAGKNGCAQADLRILGCCFGGALEELVDEGLIGFGLLCGKTAQLDEQTWRNTDSDELLSIAGLWPADAAGAAQFDSARFGDIREIDAAIRNMPGARGGSLDAR